MGSKPLVMSNVSKYSKKYKILRGTTTKNYLTANLALLLGSNIKKVCNAIIKHFRKKSFHVTLLMKTCFSCL